MFFGFFVFKAKAVTQQNNQSMIYTVNAFLPFTMSFSGATSNTGYEVKIINSANEIVFQETTSTNSIVIPSYTLSPGDTCETERSYTYQVAINGGSQTSSGRIITKGSCLYQLGARKSSLEALKNYFEQQNITIEPNFILISTKLPLAFLAQIPT